jgi:hypothetical protein
MASPTDLQLGPTTRLFQTATASSDPKNRDYILSQLDAWYQSLGLTPGGRGSGGLDREYYADQIVATGGWTDRTDKGENNIGYWTNRISSDLARGGQAPASGTVLGASGPYVGPRPPGTGGGAFPGSPTSPLIRPGVRSGPPAATATTRATGANAPAAENPYAAASLAALRARKRGQGLGRNTTILGGFGGGSPSTRPPTLLGY